jgi:MFS family permease
MATTNPRKADPPVLPQEMGLAMSEDPRAKRTLGSYTLYFSLGSLGYLLTGLGVILPQLRAEMHADRAQVALYPAAFSLGLVIVGVLGTLVVRWLGRMSLAVSLATYAVGAILLGTGISRYVNGAGAVLLGLGGAGLFFLVPLALRQIDPGRMAVSLAEGHGFSSAASVVVPLVIAGATAVGAGWRAGYLVPSVTVIAVVLMVGISRHLLVVPGLSEEIAARPPTAFLLSWLDVLLVVIAEFCMVFWTTDFLKTQRGMHYALAAALTALLVGGMATGRILSGVITARIGSRQRVLVFSAVLAICGFALLWTLKNPFSAATGLLIAGLGLALLYPTTLAEAIEAWPQASHRASARCAIASGLAILAATVGLGWLADLSSLPTAMLMMPAVLALFLVRRAMAT